MAQFILRLPKVKGRTGLGRTSIYNGVKAGTFPAPVHLGPRAVGWLESDITDWIEQCVAARGAPESANTVRGVDTAESSLDIRSLSGVAP